jgi:hypothetical protein
VKYRPLAELRISHAYYRGGRCPDFEVTPSAAGARTAANFRLIVKPRPDGVQVLAPVDANDAPFIAFAADTRLGLELRAKNRDLPLFTYLAALRATKSPLFVNPDASAGGVLSLGPGTPRSGLSGDLFAEVELRGVNASWLVGGPARFTLSLASKQARWVYYVVTDFRDGDVELVDTDTSPLVFTPNTGTDMNAQPDPDDRQATRLAALYPGARLLRFVSAAAVACAEEPRRKLELRLKGEPLPLRLPNPALSDYASLAVDPIPQRQESLFRVVKHLTHSFTAHG